MKKVITIPDEVFEAAEDLAQELGVSRSRLYSRAVSEFVARCRDDRITERLNEVYGDLEARVDPHLDHLQICSINEEW
jgi:predicted transcriptional regulator